jgi:hypothetical protein
MVLDVEQLGLLELGSFAIDAGGVIAARRARRRQGGTLHVPGAKEEDILKLLRSVHSGLQELGATGRAAAQFELRGCNDMLVQNQSDGAVLEVDSLYASAYLPVPASDQELDAIAEDWVRELGRAAGLPLWET